MRVLLVSPSHSSIYKSVGMQIPPLGLAYLASALRAAGHETAILDANVGRVEDFGGWGAWDVVGVGTDTTRVKRAYRMARDAKARGATVVFGGPHPTTVDEGVARHPAVDFVVRSEGEETLPALLAVLEGGGDPSAVPGLTMARNGGIVRTPDRPFRMDLDAIAPPARDLLPMDRYHSSRLGRRAVSPVVTSRGCPYRCSFCASSFMNGPRWRAHSATRVVDEMEELHRRWGYGAVAFSDDNSMMSPARIARIADELRSRKLDLYVWAFCRADMAARNPDMVADFADAGLRSVFIGIESPTPDRLKAMAKGIDRDDIETAIRTFRENNVEILGSYILGMMGDTLRTVRETMRLSRALDTNTATFSILTPYPGTEIYRQLEDRITNRDWSAYDGYHLVFRHNRLSRLQLELSLGLCHLAFYFRSLRSILGMARYLWLRRPGVGHRERTAHDATA